MSDPIEVHVRATLVALTPGDPASVTLSRNARHDGKTRTAVQKIPTPAALFERLLDEVDIGQDIEATVITEWRTSGYTTRLADFRAISHVVTETAHVA
jgi:hypothetical protein